MKNFRFACVAVLLVACSQPEPHLAVAVRPRIIATASPLTPLPAPTPTPDRELLELRKVRDSWLTHAEKVAKATRNPQALFIVERLRENAVIAVPDSRDGKRAIRFLESAKRDKPWFAFVLLRKGAMLPHAWEKYQTISAIAVYIPDIRAIVIRDVPMSPTWKGIILLHEGDHAMATTSRPYNWQDPWLYSVAERDTHTFENQIAAALGGEKYRKLLEQEVKRVHAGMIQMQGAKSWPSRTDYHQELDVVFGRAESQLERDVRETHLWIHAIFVAMEETYPQDYAAQQQAKLLSVEYAEGLHKE